MPGPPGECAVCRRTRPARNPLQAKLRAKLRVGPADDRYEREADRLADAVARAPADATPTPAPVAVRRVGGGGPGREAPASVDAVLASPGRPLDGDTRQFMEARMGHDFSRVRIHVDGQAAASARAVGARAYTVGRDVVFGAGEFRPGTAEGRRLIAHELTHVVQQGGVPRGLQRAVAYTGPVDQGDIDPTDPTTAPAGNAQALGHTAFFVNGSAFQSLSAQQTLDALFPLPAYDQNSFSCDARSRSIAVTGHSVCRYLTAPPWSRTLPKSQVSTLFGGAVTDAACAGAGNAVVGVAAASGGDAAFREWSRLSEHDHAADDSCLIDRYVKAYESDVAALPASFSRGYMSFGSCTARLEERLERPARLQQFVSDMNAFTRTYDGPGGSHLPRATPRVGAGCSTVTLSIRHQPRSPASRTCTAWSPP